MSFIGKNPKVDELRLTPQSSDPTNPAEGEIFRSDGTSRAKGLWEYKDSNWVQIGSDSQGIKNYFSDGVFEGGVTLASIYDDGGSYVDGTGGSPAEISISPTSSALAGAQSLQIDKAGSVSAVGEGVTLTSDTIDLIDLGKDLFFQFAYDANDTNYTTDDVIVKAYDVTNSQELTIVPVANLTDSAGLYKKLSTAYGKVLVNSTTAQVRLSLHVETDTVVSSAWTITVDEAQLSPNSVLVGNISTDTSLYTPTWIGGSPSIGNGTLQGTYRREGDTLYGTIYLLAGSTTTFGSGQWEFSLPAGLTIDSNKLNNSNSVQASGVAYANDQSGTLQIGTVQLNPTNDTVYIWSQGTGSSWRSTVPFTWVNTDYLSIEFKAPITEWSTGNLLSAHQASFQTVKVAAAIQTGESLTADTTDISFTVESLDTHNAWDGNQFTAPNSGTYDVEGLLRFTANANRAISAYVNGTVSKAFSTNAYNGILSKFSGSIYLDQGDVLSFRTDVSETTATGIQSNNWITIESRPDFTVFGMYGETEYKEVILGANSVTTTASTPVDVTGASLALTPGEWQVGYGATVYLNWVSGSSLGIIGNLRITDSSNNTVNGSESGCFTIANNADDDVGHYMTSTVNIIVTSPDTYKMRLTCNQSNTAAQAFVDVTSGLFGDGIMWARRIK